MTTSESNITSFKSINKQQILKHQRIYMSKMQGAYGRDFDTNGKSQLIGKCKKCNVYRHLESNYICNKCLYEYANCLECKEYKVIYGNNLCDDCFHTPNCAKCGIKFHNDTEDYCKDCIVNKGKCRRCKKYEMLCECGLCLPCEYTENVEFLQGRSNIIMDDRLFNTKKNCSTCSKENSCFTLYCKKYKKI